MRLQSMLAASALLVGFGHAQEPTFVNSLTLPGEATDHYVGNTGANFNRLGGPFSDLYYDRKGHHFYGLIDRGPGGGVLPYETRVQKFKVNVDPKTGAISHFRIQQTILFRTGDGALALNGLNPLLLSGNKATLGLSFDPEGFTVGPNGNFFVADEYGPSVYEFAPTSVSDTLGIATLVRTFTPPANLLPFEGSLLNFVEGRPILTSGRQDNRGYEGLTISPDGTKLYAILQDPLINEGNNNEGRRGVNVRIVEYSVALGVSTRQFVYQLESVAQINDRIPGTANDFGATSQGRNIGVSAITALNDTQFLVLERDNRGLGVEDALMTLPVGSKRVYRIDIANATDVSGMSLAGTNALPVGVNPVTKSLFIDIAASLQSRSHVIPEKLEGLAIGPQVKDGGFVIFAGTDNDFSVTQNGSNVQFDVYTDGTTGPIDGDANGRSLIPTFMFSYRGPVPGLQPAP